MRLMRKQQGVFGSAERQAHCGTCSGVSKFTCACGTPLGGERKNRADQLINARSELCQYQVKLCRI